MLPDVAEVLQLLAPPLGLLPGLLHQRQEAAAILVAGGPLAVPGGPLVVPGGALLR